MPTSSDIMKEKREREAWDAHMASLRAAEAAKVAPVPSAEPEPAPLLGPDGQPIPPEPSDG